MVAACFLFGEKEIDSIVIIRRIVSKLFKNAESLSYVPSIDMVTATLICFMVYDFDALAVAEGSTGTDET